MVPHLRTAGSSAQGDRTTPPLQSAGALGAPTFLGCGADCCHDVAQVVVQQLQVGSMRDQLVAVAAH
eukprot:6748762-Alexandrium_andersonii.AAC.1